MGKHVEYIWYKNNWYHPNFFRRGPYCLKRAKYSCQHCGIKRGEEYITQKGKIDKAVIQAAHVNHDPKNPRAKLIALCKPCHLKYDGPMHGKKASQTKKLNNLQRQKSDGQLAFNWKLKKDRKRAVA